MGVTRTDENKAHAVTCVPLSAVLAAVNVTHIDYMVLDVEGNEPKILDSIDFDKVEIDFLQIECNECFSAPDGTNEVGVPTCAFQRLLQNLTSSKGFEEIFFIPIVDIVYKRKTLKL